ncbi:MAG: serine/threonine protein kinase, partial [Polyangiaceae bacterium]|nr:serine/threonine protein kinase [Polyangiaceae bacterium]
RTSTEAGPPPVAASGANLLATGLYNTRTGVLGERLLEEHGQALQAYLCIRTGDAARAAAAYDDLVVWLNRQKRSALEEGPSLRALICRAARVVGGSASDTDDYQPRQLDTVPWEPAPVGSIEGYDRVLDHVRRNLRTGEAELLALRYSHDLDVAELAYVFDEPAEIIERRLRTALAWADLLVSESSGGYRIETAEAVRDAFRVIPSAVLQFSTAKAPRPPRLAQGTRIGDRYEIGECIGGGAFAWVYRAYDVHVPGHSVALKVLHRPSRTAITREGAVRELGLIASAFHPSLVQFKDYGWFCERLWFVMPWYEGETLKERIERGPMSLDEALSIFIPLARALSALHGAGVIHHDVKPENVLLAELRGDSGMPTGEILPVLLDLGVAAPEGELTLAGTPMYFSPEAAERIVSAD